MSEYFSQEAATSNAMRIVFKGKHPQVTLTDGITAAPLMGERLNINIVTLAPGAVAPAHAHDEEQMGYVVSGSCDSLTTSAASASGPATPTTLRPARRTAPGPTTEAV